MITKVKSKLGSGLLALMLLASSAAFAEDSEDYSSDDQAKLEANLDKENEFTNSDSIDFDNETSETSWLDMIKSYFSYNEDNS